MNPTANELNRALVILANVRDGARSASTYSWKTVVKVYRELAALGMIEKDASGRWKITDRGKTALDDLNGGKTTCEGRTRKEGANIPGTTNGSSTAEGRTRQRPR